MRLFAFRLAALSSVILLSLLSIDAAFCKSEHENSVIPQGGASRLAKDPLPDIYRYPAADPSLATSDIVDAQNMPFHKAIRTTTYEHPSVPWDVGVGTYLSEPIAQGDVCLLSFFVRGESLRHEHAEAKVHAYFEFAAPPHDKIAAMPVAADKEWREIYVPFRAPKAMPKGSVRIIFHLGFSEQTVEIGGISFLDFGQHRPFGDLPVTRLTYKGREPEAPWRKQAADRIEEHRKDRLAVQVVDSYDKPIEGAVVHVTMLSHTFGFGSAVTAKLLGVDINDSLTIREYFEHYSGAENILTYRNTVENLFNKVTFENDLKLLPWLRSKSNQDSSYRREWTDRALDWLDKRNIPVRGHWIACGRPEELPTEMLSGPRFQLRDYIFANISEKLKAIGNRVAEWDAINHIVSAGGNFETLFDTPEINVEVMKRSRGLLPNVPFWVNEGSILSDGALRDSYVKIVRYLIDHGAAPDGIGFMGHFDRFTLTPPDELDQVFQRFAKLIPNLQITELDVDVGDDEQLQADYLRDAMTVAFSEEACRGIVLWGFWEGRIDKPNASLFRKDWSLKPAGKVWKDLVFREWRTDVQGKTDHNGEYGQRCFLGTYEIAVTSGGLPATAQIALEKGGTTVKIRLK